MQVLLGVLTHTHTHIQTYTLTQVENNLHQLCTFRYWEHSHLNMGFYKRPELLILVKKVSFYSRQ